MAGGADVYSGQDQNKSGINSASLLCYNYKGRCSKVLYFWGMVLQKNFLEHYISFLNGKWLPLGIGFFSIGIKPVLNWRKPCLLLVLYVV